MLVRLQRILERWLSSPVGFGSQHPRNKLCFWGTPVTPALKWRRKSWGLLAFRLREKVGAPGLRREPPLRE